MEIAEAVKSSRLPGFYKLSLAERVAMVAEWAELCDAEAAVLAGDGLQPAQADLMIENALGTYALPLGVAANFLINGRDYLIPMAVEEPSVLAAVSHSAKLIRAGGGFTAEASEPVMIGQIQLLDVGDGSAADMTAAALALDAHRDELLALADACSPSIVRRGGGARGIEVRPFPDTPVGPMLIIHLLYDTRDAMGANAINTAVETIAPRVAEITGGRTNLRILSNLTDRRTATACGRIPAAELTLPDIPGDEVARLVAEANAFAVVDPYRAATHNKGIMNGVDAVVLATGNDFRAVEAGAHAYAAQSGRYRPLATWHRDGADLVGSLELPLSLGIVGGTLRVHPVARLSLRMLDVTTAAELQHVAACAGLASNLAALRALATEGIQRGHMSLHARAVATAAGAVGDQVERVAAAMAELGLITLEEAGRQLTKIKGVR